MVMFGAEGVVNGRFVVSNWDMEELEGKKGGVVERNLFKYRMTI